MQFVNTKYMQKLINVLATKFSEEQRKEIYDYFQSLTGSEFAKDSVKNYSPKGKAINVKEPLESGQVKAKKTQSVKTASKEDLNVIERYWQPLYGKDYAKKMIQSEEKSKQTKTAKRTKKNVLNQRWE